MGEMCDSFFTVHFYTHPLGTCRKIPEQIRILRIGQGIDPNIRQGMRKMYSRKVPMGKQLCNSYL